MFYDWAESAFTVIVSAFIFPILYGILTKDVTNADVIYSFIVSAISLLIAILSPILGTIADYKGYKGKMFLFFFVMGIVFTALIGWFPAEQSLWWVVLIPYVLSVVGYSGTNVFYDSFIVDATTDENMDRVSTAGYAFGYIGGSTIPLILALVLLQYIPYQTYDIFGFSLNYDWTLAFKITFLMTSLWWLVFAIPFLKNVKQVYGIDPEPHPVRQSFKRLWDTLKEARQYRHVFLFLIAFFLYIDGVHTIINVAVRFADNAIEAVTAENAVATLIPILLAIQVLAFFFALLFAWLTKFIDSKKLLLITIGVYSVISIFGVFVTEVWHFWVLGLLVATSQGAIQSLSRSHFGKIIPKDKANEFFGLYNVFGRFASVLGPVFVGAIALFFDPNIAGGNMRYGVLSLIVLFIAGGLLFVQSLKLEPSVNQK